VKATEIEDSAHSPTGGIGLIDGVVIHTSRTVRPLRYMGKPTSDHPKDRRKMMKQIKRRVSAPKKPVCFRGRHNRRYWKQAKMINRYRENNPCVFVNVAKRFERAVAKYFLAALSERGTK